MILDGGMNIHTVVCGGGGEEVETFKMVVLSKTVYSLEVSAGERREGERKKGREGEIEVKTLAFTPNI